ISVLEYREENRIDFDLGMLGGVKLDYENGVFRRYHVGANPVNRTDPSGLAPGDWWHPILHPVEFYNRARELRVWGHQNFPGEANSDARHSSYMLAKEYGPVWARLAGDANEVQGFIMHDIPNLPDRIKGNSPWAFQLKDAQANEMGIQRAIQERRAAQNKCK
ncbi:MAG: hypothetical protein AB1553_15975, partial [Nitrospirota bacterium]